MAEIKEILLCLDVGTKRIGVAKSDLLGVAAHSLTFVSRKNDDQAIGEIEKLVLEEQVAKIVIGLPLDLSGKMNIAAESVRTFADKLRNKITIPIEFWDERFSTAQAERFLIEEADLSRRKRKVKIDSLAALMILKSYMEAKS